MSKFLFFVMLIAVFVKTQAQTTTDFFQQAKNGNLKAVEQIVKENPNWINQRNENGFTALILATYSGKDEMVKWLVEHGSTIDFNTEMGTALMAAVVKGNLKIAHYLLKNKANPNLFDTNGVTALIYAVQFKNFEMVALLLKYNANKLQQDHQKKTAFEYAVFIGDERIINLLK